jgi:hypothetical protein
MADENCSVNEDYSPYPSLIDDKLQVHGEFVGLYSVPSIDSDTLMAVTKDHDAFLRMNISFMELRGQCCDGASVMKGSKSGIATRICNLKEGYTQFVYVQLEDACSIQ